MSLNLSKSQLQQIANQIFILKSPSPAHLPKPVNSAGDNSLTSKLHKIWTAPRFKDLGIGVVVFPNQTDFNDPKIWLHNGDKPWQVASTGKIALLLAAVQLRHDVREVKKTGLISTKSQFDEIFKTIWLKIPKTKPENLKRKWISQIPQTAPRISTIFDLTKSPIDFIGSEKDLKPDGSDRILLVNYLNEKKHLRWSDVPDYTFWERLWLTGARSDNIAATTCISEVGIAYMKAVQLAYGLYNPRNGMHLCLAGGYYAEPEKFKKNPHLPRTLVSRAPGAPKYRKLNNYEKSPVLDPREVKKKTANIRPNFLSTQPGSAAALTAYMIALMQDKFVNKEACDTIRYHLASEKNDTTESSIRDGVNEIADVTKAYTKIGVGNRPTIFSCEFAYLKADELKYAVLVTGLLPKKVGQTSYNDEEQGKDLGKLIHIALS